MPDNPLTTAVDAMMLRACSASSGPGCSVVKAIEHHLAAGGSRVRATFSLQASQKLGLETQDAIVLAAICETLHNASLIHDDLLDRAPMRRESPSVWAAFGDITAVCSGDLLLATAFALVSEIKKVEYLPKILSLVHQRTRDVVLGQDAEQTSAPINLADYEQIAIGKSASLLSLPFELSLLISGNESFLGMAKEASDAFAVAYQMVDDLNDYSEDRRNGLVNAVSVVMDAGRLDHASAVNLICQRAEELIGEATRAALRLPKDSGAAMIAYADTLLLAISRLRDVKAKKLESLLYGG